MLAVWFAVAIPVSHEAILAPGTVYLFRGCPKGELTPSGLSFSVRTIIQEVQLIDNVG